MDTKESIAVERVAKAIWRESVIQDDPDKKPPEEWNLSGMPPYTWEFIADERKGRWRAIARAALAVFVPGK